MADRQYEPEPLDWSFTYRVREMVVAHAVGDRTMRVTAERKRYLDDYFTVRSEINYDREVFAAMLLASLEFDPPKVDA